MSEIGRLVIVFIVGIFLGRAFEERKQIKMWLADKNTASNLKEQRHDSQ